MTTSTPIHRRRLARRRLGDHGHAPVAADEPAGAGHAGAVSVAARDRRPVPRWARIAAHLVPVVTLPSGLWRIALVIGLIPGPLEAGAAVAVNGRSVVYIVSLSVVSEGAALLTFGLVRPWGERFPAWIPGIGGRRIPPTAVITPAALGALVLQAIWTFAFRHPTLPGLEFPAAGWKALVMACYAPLLLWGPLLAAVTWAYWRRRCRD